MLNSINNIKQLYISLVISKFSGGPEGPGEDIDTTQEALVGAKEDGEILAKSFSPELDSAINDTGDNLNTNLENIENRDQFNIDSLKELGTINEDNPIGTFTYIDSMGNKCEMTFDINSQTIEFNGTKIHIDLGDAKLSEITFGDKELAIEGKIGWFSGEGSAEYGVLFNAIEDTFKEGGAMIAAGDREVNFTRV